MSFINKFAWSGVAVVLAVVLGLGVMAPRPASAAALISVTAGAVKTVSIATNTATGTGACTIISNMVFDEAAAADVTSGRTFVLTPPTGWTFCANGSVAVTSVVAATPSTTPVTASVALAANVLTATTSGTSTGALARFTWSGVGLRPDTAASASGTIALTGT
ncbi:MAG: hypothetical protein DWI59_06045, partial [Chloroflexi bacterium]